MLYLKQADYDKILKFAEDGLPNEVCGLIAGTGEGDRRMVAEVYLLTNIDQSPEHFSMDPGEQLQAVKEMRRKNISLLGNFHSHPETPARPSDEDIRLAHDPKASYLILSLENQKEPVLRAFRIEKGQVRQDSIEII